MFEGFEELDIDSGEAVIHLRRGGSGPPLLLLHGHPQTHVMWHRVAPRLARDFTVVTPDDCTMTVETAPVTAPERGLRVNCASAPRSAGPAKARSPSVRRSIPRRKSPSPPSAGNMLAIPRAESAGSQLRHSTIFSSWSARNWV